MNNEIVVFDEVMATLTEFKAKNDNIVYDCSDPKGNKACRSHIAHLRKFKTRIATVHKEAKAGALEYGRRLDDRKNEYTAVVEEMIAVKKAPLDVIEAEKQAQIDEDVRKHAEVEAKVQAELEAKAKAFEEIQAKEAAEKAAAERIVREKQIAEEAAKRATVEAEAKAKMEAEAVERAKLEAEHKAKADAEAAVRAIAEAKAQHKAQSEAAERAKAEEIQRVKAEAKLKADAKERVRLDAEQKAKAEADAKEAKYQALLANEEHCQEVQDDIEKFLVNMGISQENAVEILTALIEEKIPHITINY